MKLTIYVGDANRVVEYVEHVAGQLEDGFTSGHVDAETNWEIEE